MKKILLAAAVLASSATNAFELPENRLRDLSRHPIWLELLHYESSVWGKARSAIKSPEFFIAPDGNEDPLAELRATLFALAQPQNDDPDYHARCRFPARAQWLATQLDLETPLSGAACPKLDNWTQRNNIQSVSIIYATGFLGNPASYYGHTLLKLNGPREETLTASELLDVSINYGAILEGRIDPASYIVKGVFGGYDGGFSDIQYYFHSQNYGETELRDLWEYPLELPPDDTRLIVNHAWEVLGMRYTYYFFRRNCAFRMAELLEMAKHTQVIPTHRPWTIPQSVIQNLDQERDTSPQTANIRYYPSRQSRFHHRFQQLENQEQSFLTEVVKAPWRLDSSEFQALSLSSQRAIIDTALDYYQFVLRTDVSGKDTLQDHYRIALSKRYQLPPGDGSLAAPAPPSPHLGRNPGWAQFGIGYGDPGNPFAQIRVRAAYYDALDGSSGHVPNSSLSMGDLTLKATASRISVRNLTFFAIESMSPGMTGLPGDDGAMWNLGAGLNSVRLDCDSCLVGRLHGDVGRASRLSENWVGSLHIGSALQNDRMGYGAGYVQLGGRAIYRHANWSGRIAYELRSPIAAARSEFSVIELEARRSLSLNRDIRFLLEHNGGNQLSIGLGWYW